MTAKDERGRAGEERARRHLEAIGYEVVAQNWRCPDGEIDLLAIDGSDLVVVEVKTRRTRDYGDPFDAVDARKRARLWRLGAAWQCAHAPSAGRRRLRLDAIGIVGDDVETAALEHMRDLR